MIHEIAPEIFDNQYRPCKPDDDSNICIFRGSSMLLYNRNGIISWPKYMEVKEAIGEVVYLFSISDKKYFLAEDISVGEGNGYLEWMHWQNARDLKPVKEAFAGMTAMHLHNWYSSVQYCGKCGTKAMHDSKERMMYCPSCGNKMFPKISPAIIAAVIDTKNNRLLVTKYNGKAQRFALVAGFVEIGETAEECVSREVMEETGIKVKNIKYYDSQPWGYAGNLMLGYIAELDGDNSIHLDKQELSTAKWLTPEEIPNAPENSSLTREIIQRFKEGRLFG